MPSCAEFCEAFELVKPNVATGRDNIPDSVLRLRLENARSRLYCAVVERLAGREDEHVRNWAELDVCLVPKKGDISNLGRWRPISLVPSLFKLYEVCVWKVLDKELRPLPCQMFGFRSGRQCLDIVSYLVESLRKAEEEGGEKLFVVSVDVASSFDAIRPGILGDALLSRGGSVFFGAAVVRENLNLFCRPSFGHVSCEPVAKEVGARQGGSRTPSAWNQLVATLVDELMQFWSGRGPAVSRAPEGNDFAILVEADNIFLTTDSVAEAARRSWEVANVFKSRKLLFNVSSLEILPIRAAEKDRTPIVLEGGSRTSLLGRHLTGASVFFGRHEVHRDAG